MPVSEKQLAANRANAQRSSGPRTPEGKARSRANGLKHGLTGAGVVLAGEDGEAIRERVDAWADDLRPDGPVESWLAERAAVASVRLDRCVRREAAALDRLVRRAGRDWDRRRHRQAEATRLDLISAPAATARRLESSCAGCDWMLERWDYLAGRLAAYGWWGDDEMALILLLLGHAGTPTHASAPVLSRFFGAALTAQLPYDDDLARIEAFFGLPPDVGAEARRPRAVALLPDAETALRNRPGITSRSHFGSGIAR